MMSHQIKTEAILFHKEENKTRLIHILPVTAKIWINIGTIKIYKGKIKIAK